MGNYVVYVQRQYFEEVFSSPRLTDAIGKADEEYEQTGAIACVQHMGRTVYVAGKEPHYLPAELG